MAKGKGVLVVSAAGMVLTSGDWERRAGVPDSTEAAADFADSWGFDALGWDLSVGPEGLVLTGQLEEKFGL